MLSSIAAMRRMLTRLLHNRFIRFLVIGAINTAFGYGIYAIVFQVSKSPNLAIVLMYPLGILFNFMTTGRIVFGNRRAATVAPFVLGYCVTMGFNIALVDVALWWGTGALLAQALSLPLVVAMSYLINAKLVFRT